MVIRSSLKTDTDAIESLIGFLEDYDSFAYEVFEAVSDEIKPQVLDELQHEPGKPKYPIQWTSERQQSAYFATNGFGGGIPYRRTGKLAQAWTVTINRDGDTFVFVVQNTAKAAAAVYGSLAQNRTQALRFQQGFHANTGWQPATDTVSFWQAAFVERYSEDLEAETEVEFEKRAFTRTR